jgi:hypothetical protein
MSLFFPKDLTPDFHVQRSSGMRAVHLRWASPVYKRKFSTGSMCMVTKHITCTKAGNGKVFIPPFPSVIVFLVHKTPIHFTQNSSDYGNDCVSLPALLQNFAKSLDMCSTNSSESLRLCLSSPFNKYLQKNVYLVPTKREWAYLTCIPAFVSL